MTSVILVMALAAFIIPDALPIILPAAGLLFYLALTILRRKPVAIDKGLSLILVAAALFITLGGQTALTTGPTFYKALRLDAVLLGILPLLAVMPSLLPSDKRRLYRIFPLITGLMGMAVIAELYFGTPLSSSLAALSPHGWTPSSLGTAETIYLVVLPFALYASSRTGHLSIGALLVLLAGLMLWEIESDTIRFAGLCGLAAPLILFLFPKSALSTPVLLTGFILAFMPFIAPLLFDVYVDTANLPLERSSPATAIGKNLEIYDFVSRKIIESPMTGHGLESSPSLIFESEKIFYPKDTISFPHNMALQIWLEFGIIGVILFGLILLCVYNRLNHTHGTQRTLAYATFLTGLMIVMFAWSIWSEWMIGALALSACLLPLAKEPPPARATS